MKQYLDKITSICDQFASWQDEDGCINKERCPYFADEYKPLFRYMEIPFMARTLYKAHDLTGNTKYKANADRYCKFYINLIENLISTEKIAYKFGLAMESACLYAKYNPMEYREYIEHAKVILKWLRQLRTEEGLYFRCGYLPGIESLKNVLDVGFSDDLCHVGRGITTLYEGTGDESVLKDIEGLANYFMTDIKEGTMDGIWSPFLGTWAIGPWPDTNFEHMDNTPANSVGWVWSAYGDMDFLTGATKYIEDKTVVDNIKSKSVQSDKWIFKNCQFEDGAVGMTGRDDKWVGLTAAAIMSVVQLHKLEYLSREEKWYFKPFVKKAWDWFLKNTGESFPTAGYIKVTGHTNPIPGDNVAWSMSWTAECLMMADTVEAYLND
jgi:hypothetical protein